MWQAFDRSAVVALAQTLGFCAFVVVCVRLRPWRWLFSWVRRG